MISTGPKLIVLPPTAHEQECKDNNFAVCERTDDSEVQVVVSPPAPTFSLNPAPAPAETPETPTIPMDTPAPTSSESEVTTDPSSRALSQITADYSYHITLAFGGIILAVGGLILAN